MQQVIAECKPKWKEDEGKAPQKVPKSSTEDQASKIRGLSDTFTTELSTVEDVLIAKKQLEELIKDNEGILNQRDKKNMKKKLKKKMKKLKKQNTNQYGQCDEGGESSDEETGVKNEIKNSLNDQKLSLKKNKTTETVVKAALEVYEDPFV